MGENMITFNLLQEETHRIVEERWTDGIVVKFGCSQKSYSLKSGVMDISTKKRVSLDTLFDLASVSKFFTMVGTLKLVEENLIDLDKKVGDYSSGFPKISELKLFELMNFSKQIITPGRIDNCESYEEAIHQLRNSELKNSEVIYTDIGIIILSHIINEVLGSPDGFKNHIKRIFTDNELHNTFWWEDIPQKELHRVMNYDNEYRLIDDKLICIHTPQGIVHDKKAQVLKAVGHAGIFSTVSDISRFAENLLEGKILKKSTIDILTSEKYDSLGSSQKFGLMCYKKIPDPIKSEIPPNLSSQSIAISGYTGTYLLLDFDNKFYMSICANRIHNRLTNAETIMLKNKVPIKCTKNYVYRKDHLRNLCVDFWMIFRYIYRYFSHE